MIPTKGYAAHSPTTELAPFNFERSEPKDTDVLIEISYCGICHADIHQAKNEYGGTIYPLVPGHEIVGRIKSVGSNAKKFKVGEMVGVGYFIDSCKNCEDGSIGEEQYCDGGIVPTQNSKLPDGTVSKGGYSETIVVDENHVLHISEKLNPAAVAPLLCAGITTYSPLKHWKIGPGHKVAVLGLGGLGHMAVKFAVSFGAEVTVLSGSPSKQESAMALGAHHFIVTSDQQQMKDASSSFHFIIDTVSAKHDYNTYLNLLKKDGTMILLGVPPEMPQLSAYHLISKRRNITGSLIGGIPETQEMLDYCAQNNITSEIEIIAPDYINTAFERTLKGDVHYRFVIDMKQLK
ncbi:NAD(P)-dependent alcohol dehydrogenase [Sphingobacterium sp. DR205]|uniref:NAD(P)-dependent alcohol dehydrogenase n=1 Tax=Sphingobacterium sp. DR205 TaxID=2713573 RepID=UPI0013E457D1|nr:NAD(P)-dependent alcohol dehydrogenase [Sphingobacterium sp. DR205]QIH34554.1 NAD(P)-dependent alcohol dehydrogenase [Sphingobacterium sp. DR205]